MTSKKKQPVKKQDPVMNMVQRILQVVVYISLFLVMIINILTSQDMPELYFHFVAHPQETVIPILQKARSLESFQSIFPEVKDIMSDRSSEIFAESYSRRDMIDTLQTTLAENPQNPEILYALSVLYKAENQEKRSSEYLKQARTLDPTVGM